MTHPPVPVAIGESSGGCGGSFTVSAAYTYDPTNNDSRGVDELTSITDSGSTDYTYTGDGQVSSYGTTSLGWDGWGRLSTATAGSTPVTYAYDPTGTLLSRTTDSPASTTKYLLGDLFETDGTGTIASSYTDGPAGDLATYSGAPTGTATFLYYDAHGNLAAEADPTGASTASHTYDPFGAPTDSVPANQTVHRFTGRWDKQYDTTTNLILMGARPYNPTTGRFLSVDPIPGGSLNNYDYAGQDPINGYDLTGDALWESFVRGRVGFRFVACGVGGALGVVTCLGRVVLPEHAELETPVRAIEIKEMEAMARNLGSSVERREGERIVVKVAGFEFEFVVGGGGRLENDR